MCRLPAASFARIPLMVAALLLAGGAWAGPRCEAPQDAAALRTAALQQYLMVAALTCHQTAAYNGFVLSHRGELQYLDRTLLDYFMRRNAETGDADYNAYKTWLANASSMRSLHDPRFCGRADEAFNDALDASKPLAELVAERRVPFTAGITSCEETAADPSDADDDAVHRQAWLNGR